MKKYKFIPTTKRKVTVIEVPAPQPVKAPTRITTPMVPATPAPAKAPAPGIKINVPVPQREPDRR